MKQKNLRSQPAVKTIEQKDIRQILTRLNHDDLMLRRTALDDLLRIGETAVPGLLVVLHTREPQVRESAAWALGELGSPQALPGLIAALNAERDPTVRDAIVWALELINDKRAVPTLLDMLEDESETARDSVAVALGNLDSVHCVEGLLKAIDHPHEDVRQSAAWALSQILIDPPSTEEFYQIARALSEHLDDNEGKVRWVCVKGVHEATMDYAHLLKGSVRPLIDRLEDNFGSPWGDPERICDVAALALTNIGTPRARTALQQWSD